MVLLFGGSLVVFCLVLLVVAVVVVWLLFCCKEFVVSGTQIYQTTPYMFLSHFTAFFLNMRDNLNNPNALIHTPVFLDATAIVAKR